MDIIGKEKPLPARVTIQRAAEYLDVTDKTIRRRIADGTLKAYRVGPRLIRIDRESLLALAHGKPLGIGAA
ncbi:excisionase family DNA-binding protein [Mycobacterium terramassiliense]|nr:excisionase family DNA-binding protein [Mycobacterium terramassiliense]